LDEKGGEVLREVIAVSNASTSANGFHKLASVQAAEPGAATKQGQIVSFFPNGY